MLASGNPGKLKELSALLAPLAYRLRPQSDWQTPAVAEDAPTFLENALIKARNATRHTGFPAIADDSGLVVPALNGHPGIHSARYSGPDASDKANNRKLLAAMNGLIGAQRKAFFQCAMVMVHAADDPVPLIACARWWGEILDSPRGERGFGYDPLFFIPDQGCSSAELDPATKNRISHRGQAMQALTRILHEGGRGIEKDYLL